MRSNVGLARSQQIFWILDRAFAEMLGELALQAFLGSRQLFKISYRDSKLLFAD